MKERIERRRDYDCRVRVAVVKSWLRKGHMPVPVTEQLLTHWGLCPESVDRIIATIDELDRAEMSGEQIDELLRKRAQA